MVVCWRTHREWQDVGYPKRESCPDDDLVGLGDPADFAFEMEGWTGDTGSESSVGDVALSIPFGFATGRAIG